MMGCWSKQGSRNARAKLTEDLVREYRAAWAAGETIVSIAQRAGISKVAASYMLHRKTWRHVA